MGKNSKAKNRLQNNQIPQMPITNQHRNLIDIFEDSPKTGSTKNDSTVAATTSGAQNETNSLNQLKPSLKNNIVVIGPRKLVGSRIIERRTIQAKQNQMKLKSSTITRIPLKDENEHQTQGFQANMPKFELNEIPNETQAEPVFELNQPQMSFIPNQPEVINTNQPFRFTTRENVQDQTGGFNVNNPDNFNRNDDFNNPNMHTQAGYPEYIAQGPMRYSYPKGIPKSMVYAQMEEMQAQINKSSPMKEEHQPNWILNDVKDRSPDQSSASVDKAVFVETSTKGPLNQAYSPSDAYEDTRMDISGDDLGSDTYNSDVAHAGQKRVSAFQRLGPQTQPKTPKITINLNLEHEEPVREVVDETELYNDDKYSPVHLRPKVINSTDETVMKYLVHWPWKKDMHIRKSIGARSSKSAMLLELQKMEELYDNHNAFFMIEVLYYPASWTKENVLDALLESLKGKSFIPCFINFTKRKCSFLVIKSKPALVEIHKMGFVIHKDEVELRLWISQISLSMIHLEFIPRLILRKRVTMGYDGDRKLNLSEFTLKEDISNFIYFPLNRKINQTEITELKTTVSWRFLTELNLSHNRLTSINGFNLPIVTPNLKHLDLSHNLINKIIVLLNCRNLPLNSISLEGNPLCLDYIDAGHYVKVIRMMFPNVTVIDGEKLHIPGTMPSFKKHYCRDDAKIVVDKFLEIFFPLLNSDEDQRSNIENLYDTSAIMTVTYNNILRCKAVYRCFRNLFLWARVIEEGNFDSVEGSTAIMKLVNKWPVMEHDPSTFNIDVMYHSEIATIVRVCGVLKLTAKTLADDEYLLAFTRTFVLKTDDGIEYKICNDMVNWGEPTKDYVKKAFQVNTITSLQLSLKLDSEPDKDLKEKLLKIFMKLTDMNRRASLRCLEEKNWHMKEALEYFAKLLKMDSLDTIMKA